MGKLTEQKADLSKIVLEIPVFGRSVVVKRPIGVPDAFNEIEKKEEGLLSRETIYLERNKPSVTVGYDHSAKSAYMVDAAGRFVSFDDETSLKEKKQFVVEKNMGGVLLNSLVDDTDEFEVMRLISFKSKLSY